MKNIIISSCVVLGFIGSSITLADDREAMIASAESAGPALVTMNATIKSIGGEVLREGTNSYICYPQQDAIGPMCNEAVWDELLGNRRAVRTDVGGIDGVRRVVIRVRIADRHRDHPRCRS